MAKKKQTTIAEDLKKARTPRQLAALQRQLLATKTLLGMRFEDLALVQDSPEKRRVVHEMAVFEKKVKAGLRIINLRLQKRGIARKDPYQKEWKPPRRLRRK